MLTTRRFRKNLGVWPRRAPLRLRVLEEVRASTHTRKLVEYSNEAHDRAQAFLLLPHSSSEIKPAGVVVYHQHNWEWHLGKSEVAGLAGDPEQAIGVALVNCGFAVFCPDAYGFEARGPGQLSGDQKYLFQQQMQDDMARVGRTLQSKWVFDATRAVDAFSSLEVCDAARLGVIGHSLGGTMAWQVAILDKRVCAAVVSGAITRHENGCDTGEALGLIAPRPLFVVGGKRDMTFPYNEALASLHKAATIYEVCGAGDKIAWRFDDIGHRLSPKLLTAAVSWLKRNLLPAA